MEFYVRYIVCDQVQSTLKNDSKVVTQAANIQQQNKMLTLFSVFSTLHDNLLILPLYHCI